MKTLLITTSLLDSVSWCRIAPNTPCKYNPSLTWKEQAYTDLKNTLARIWVPGNKAVERGQAFETAIFSKTATREGVLYKASDKFKTVVDMCRGGVPQVKSRTFLAVDDVEYCIFGKLDVDLPALDTIIDIKTTQEYKGQSKYLGSMQHKVYCYAQRRKNFKYIVAVFNGETDLEIQELHEVNYTMLDRNAVGDEIEDSIRKTVSFLKEFDGPGELWDLYQNTFTKY